MPAVPNGLAGSVTVAILVGCGIFFYPWLLRRRFGAAVMALVSVILATLYFHFDAGHSDAVVSAAFALLWAAAPVITGVIVYRLQRR